MSSRTFSICLFLIGCGLVIGCSTDVEKAPADTTNERPACESKDDCDIGQVCQEGRCVAPSGCDGDEDCPGNQICRSNGCYVPQPDTDDDDPEDSSPPDVEETETAEVSGETTSDGCFASDRREKCFPGNADTACGIGGDICKECEGRKICEKGQCVEPPECSPDSCNGCCKDGRCVSGSEGDACGTGGEQCQQCIHGATCEDGKCELPCNENTCPDGCCTRDGNCADGTSKDNCGTNGVSCNKCDPDTETCDPNTGQCAQQSCRDRCPDGCCSGDTCLDGDSSGACGTDGRQCVDCGAGRTCDASNGFCSIRDGSKWDLKVLDTEIPKKNGNGGSWDLFGGQPDPYLTVDAEGPDNSYDGKTDVISDQRNPQWDTRVLTNVIETAMTTEDSVQIKVWDKDRASPDDPIGRCTTNFISQDFDGTIFEVFCAPDTFQNEEVTIFIRFKLFSR